MKELNGKVENTHKQDDREFYAVNHFKDDRSLSLCIKGYNDRWNGLRATKVLGRKTPNEVIYEAYVRALAMHLVWNIKSVNELQPTPGDWPQAKKKKNRTRKPSVFSKHLKYLEWLDKNKLSALITYPTMSQNYPMNLQINRAPGDIGAHFNELNIQI